MNYEEELKTILKGSYTNFLTNLGKHMHDPKFIETIKLLSKRKKIAYKTLEVPVTQLIPTQNEIDIHKSIYNPLNDPFLTELYLRTKKGIVAVDSKRIVTCGNGKYIIDGHHRWSQLLALNPQASILALDFYELEDPFQALEYTQIGVFMSIGYMPTATVTGPNLLIVNENILKNYIYQNLKNSAIQIFFKYQPHLRNIYDITEFIFQNLEIIRHKNTPIPNSLPRRIMPQTDEIEQKWFDNIPKI